MTKIPILDGEPASLLLEAAKIQSFIDAVVALDKLPEQIREPIKKLARIVNECAFVAGVMYERRFAVEELAGTYPYPQTCTRDDHECAVEGQGPCNGYPREHTSPADEHKH